MCSRLLKEKAYQLVIILLGYYPPVCDRCFAIDCFSHVRLHRQPPVLANFWNQVLIDTASIAIWNRNKVVVTLAITVWGTSGAFHIQSKPIPLTAPVEDLESHGAPYNCGLANRCHAGE
jgi:hypothetical protein